jgi:hypothetical protein
MNLRKFLFTLCISLTIIHLPAFAQRDSIPLTTIIDKTAKYMAGHPIEKVYLQFDKPYYAVGDTIWLKGYVTTDIHVPSQLSKILYVDLVSPQGEMAADLKIPLVNGVGNSFIALKPAFYKLGNYHLRAYTRWMRNFDQAYFFNKTITVGTTTPGQIVPIIAFKNNITEKQAKVNITVTYKDQDGSPYAGKKVNWKVTSDENNISKGRGETDANGKLEISFSTDKPESLNSANVVTDMEVSEKNVVTKTFPFQVTTPQIDFQFFPEGGFLINGVRSRVAFKAVKPNGLGIDAKGTIVDNTGATVADFASQHLGMGVFAILPEDGKTYKANVMFADGTKASFDLPDARAEGMNMSVNNNNPDTLNIKITTNDLFLKKNQNKAFYVIAQSNGVICYAAQTILRNTLYGASIPKSKFPTGIVQVTVFSSKGSPLSERIAFIQHHDQLNLALHADKPLYQHKGKVNMTVTAKNKSLPAEGSFSVAIINERVVPFDEDAETTILSHLLLTSDLRGFVENPNYYFVHQDNKAVSDLDVLMLTQGYRRFSFRNIVSDRIPQLSFLPEQGIDISGTLRTNTGMPVAKGNIRLFIPDKSFSTQTVTDMSGNFRFTNIILADSSTVTINARDNSNGNNLVVTLNPAIMPPTTQYINPVGEVTNIDSTLRPYLENTKKQDLTRPHVIQEVVVKSTVVEKKPSHLDYSSLQGLAMDPDHTIPGDRFKGCPVLSQCIASAAMGLTYENNNLYLTRNYSSGDRTPVAVYVDGAPVDFNYLDNVNADNVESAEVFYSDGFSNINRTTGTKGVLEVNLKKKPKGEKISKEQLMDLLPKPNVVTFTPGGYSPMRVFYSPKYTTPESAKTPDFRSTIYWNPTIITDKNGNASFQFYNNDNTGTYKAIIEGIDKDGNLGYSIYRYEVQ